MNVDKYTHPSLVRKINGSQLNHREHTRSLNNVGLYVLNIKERQDRWIHFLEDIRSTGYDGDIYHFSAVKYVAAPWIGCLLSHIGAISHFLSHTSHEHLLIFEDDVYFPHPQFFIPMITHLLRTENDKHQPWDVVHLGYSFYREAKDHSTLHLHRIDDVRSSSAMFIQRKFALAFLQITKMV